MIHIIFNHNLFILVIVQNTVHGLLVLKPYTKWICTEQVSLSEYVYSGVATTEATKEAASVKNAQKFRLSRPG